MSIKRILKPLLAPLSLVNKIIPKDQKKLFFYSNLGFRDNVKALYDYAVEIGLNKTHKLIVSTDECEKFKQQAPKNVKFVSTKRGVFSFFRAKYCFYSFGKYPIMPSKNQTVVNLWHGMPLKSIGRFVKGCENEKQNYFSHIIATSPFFAEVMCKAFDAKKEQVIITSQPRCDALFKNAQKPDFLQGFDKIVFWLPTFMSSKKLGRQDGQYNSINPYDADFLKQIDQILKDKNMLLLIKPHPMDDVVSVKTDFTNVYYTSDDELNKKGLNLYDILRDTDALITDFSSIYFDFLMLNRPIAFAGVDSDKYGKSRGFSIENPNELMPGVTLSSNEEFAAFLKDTAEGRDEMAEQREKCNQICNTCLGDGCPRVLKEIGLI